MVPVRGERELCSWKEIASYLDVGVRTAQDWERTRGLPVHRLPGPRSPVRASVDELDNWREQRDAEAEPPGPVPVVEASDPVSVIPGASIGWGHALHRAWPLVGILVLVFVGTAWAVWHHHGPPLRYRIYADDLIITDASGRECWRKTIPGLAAQQYASRQLVWFGDLDGDGTTEVFAVIAVSDPGVAQPLVCFTAGGRERWRYVPDASVRTVSMTFAPPFNVRHFHVARFGREHRRAILVTSFHALYAPCQVALLSPEGRVLRSYWHNGHLDQALVTKDGREVVLAGIHNPTREATLIALDPDTMAGAAIEDNAAAQFQGFAPGVEVARLVFPRSDMNQLLEPFARVRGFWQTPGGFTVEVEHRPSLQSASVFYHLDDGLRLEQIVVGSSFEQHHAALFATHTLAHTLGPDEIKELRTVRGVPQSWMLPK